VTLGLCPKPHKLFEKFEQKLYENHVSHDFLIIIYSEIVYNTISKSFWDFQGYFLKIPLGRRRQIN
jgi:hypothetical protein